METRRHIGSQRQTEIWTGMYKTATAIKPYQRFLYFKEHGWLLIALC
jgi:hypothetical protein